MKKNLRIRIESIKNEIERMENNNDGSREWVDTIQALHIKLDELEMEQINEFDKEFLDNQEE